MLAILIAAMLVMPLPAAAAGVGGSLCEAPTPGAMTAELLHLITILREAGVTVATGALAAVARNLLAALAGIAFAWCGIRMLLMRGGAEDAISTLLQAVLHFGFAWWLISGYEVIQEQFAGGFAWLSGAALDQDFAARGDGDTTELVGANLQCGLHSLWRIVVRLWTTAAYLSSNLFSGFNIGRIVGDVVLLLELLLLMTPFLIAILVYALSAVMIQFFYVVVVAVGPVFIAFTVLPRLRFLFEGWLRALLSVLLYNVLLLLMLGIAGGMIDFTLESALDDIERALLEERAHAARRFESGLGQFDFDKSAAASETRGAHAGSPFQSLSAFSIAFFAMLFLWKMFAWIPHLVRILLSGRSFQIVPGGAEH